MVLIRILTAIDISVFHARGIPFVVAATTALLVTALLVVIELRRDAGSLAPLTWLGPMLLLSTAAVVDCSIPINSVYPLTLLFIVTTLILFDIETKCTGFTAFRRTAAIVTAILATMANAVGLVVWPALLWSAWRGGARRGWLLTIAAIGIGYGMIYMRGLPSIDHGDPLHIFTFAHLWKMADYLLVYLGLPLSRAPALGFPARILGGILLAAGIVVVLRDAASPRIASRLHRFAVGLVMTALAGACLAAVGRVDLEPEVKIPVRYAVMVAPLHIGLLALALSWLARRADTRPQQVWSLGVALAFATVLLVMQVLAGRAAATASDAIAMTLDRYQSGFRDPGMERVVFPDLDMADRVTAALRNIDAPPR
jgi:hypothetical protein